MTISKTTLVDALRARYDAYSAGAVYELACTRAGLPTETDLDAGQLPEFRESLARVGDRIEPVLAQIDAIIAESAPAPAVTAAPATPAVPMRPPVSAPAAPEAPATPAAPAPAAASVPPASSEASSDASSDDGLTTIVLRAVELAEGEELLVCGAAPELGNWDPTRAAPMSRDGDHWHASVKLTAEIDIPFKFLRRAANGKSTWEPGDNRSLKPNQRLDVTWRA